MNSISRTIFLLPAVCAAIGLVAVSTVGASPLPPRECLTRDCPEYAPVNGELVGTYGSGHQQRHVRFSPFPDTNQVPFGGTFKFYYGVKRQSTSQSGAIGVRVVKFLKQPSQRSEFLDKTLLYRNKLDGPIPRGKFDGWIHRSRYDRWHRGENITSNRLRTQFHAKFRDDEHTSEPAGRRRSFLFEANGDVLQKAYILGYRRVRPDGTWINFNIKFSKPYNRVHITVIDLGMDVDGDPEQWDWQFEGSVR